MHFVFEQRRVEQELRIIRDRPTGGLWYIPPGSAVSRSAWVLRLSARMESARLRPMRAVWCGLVLVGAACGAWAQRVDAADGTLERQIAAMVAEPAVARAHWGVMVAGMDGVPLARVNAGQFFQPASNAKLFTTAAAMALLGPGRTFVTQVLVGDLSAGANAAMNSVKPGNVVLVGGGDANLSGRELPYVAPKLRVKPAAGAVEQAEPDPLRYLAAMADQIVAGGVKDVPGDVIGDDSVWPWEPYPQDWALDDAVWGYGAPVSALSVADNQMRLTVTPGTAATPGTAGRPATVRLEQGAPYYTVVAQVTTLPAKTKEGGVQVERAPGSRVLRVYGAMAADAGDDVEEVAIDDPAEYAAMAFKAMLEARGVTVQGRARALHRLNEDGSGFLGQTREALPADRTSETAMRRRASSCVNDCDLRNHVGLREMATHASPALGEDVVVTNKVSQNLHAELLLRQLGEALGDTGSAAQGARVVRDFLVRRVGIDADDFVFYDGSGLSGHDLVTPRATVRLLTWASGQPWFAGWRASLPVGGEDGSLASRFAKAPLAGKVFAKTGTLGEARALSGYVVCTSGRTVAFSIMVDLHAPGGSADREVMDRIVGAIAAAE